MTVVDAPAQKMPQEPKRRSWFARHKIMTGVLAFVALMVAVSATSGGGTSADSDKTAAGSQTGISSTQPAGQGAKVKANKVPHKAKPARPAMSRSQANAMLTAKNYLSMTGFSRLGLIDQLSSSYGDGYSRADATFAVNHLKVSWNKQAVRAGKKYLEMTAFSRNGLIGQLSSGAGDKFTHAQAVYAVNHLGL